MTVFVSDVQGVKRPFSVSDLQGVKRPFSVSDVHGVKRLFLYLFSPEGRPGIFHVSLLSEISGHLIALSYLLSRFSSPVALSVTFLLMVHSPDSLFLSPFFFFFFLPRKFVFSIFR